MDDITSNILIVVDVQNCFIDGGGIGGQSKSEALVSEIADLVESIPFDYYVVTRDSHPANHISHMVTSKKGEVLVNHQNGRRNSMAEVPAFLGSLGVEGFEPVNPVVGIWPPHCRSLPDEAQYIGKCKARTNLGEVNNTQNKTNRFQKDAEGKPNIGTQPSNLYKNHYDRAPILRYFSKPDMKLSLLDEPEMHYSEASDTKFNLTVTNIPGSKDARGPVLQVLKGQLCNWDAFSAFQYHADFRRGPLVNDVRGSLENTTGLAEVLFSKELGITHFKPSTKKVNIVVCGLVGEICVKYTISYGLNILINAKKQGGLKGYNRIQGFPLTADKIPDVHFIYSSYGTRFIPKPANISGVYGIRNEITSRIIEAGGNPNIKNTGLDYELLLPDEGSFLDKIDPTGTLMGTNIKSVTDALGITKSGGKRTRRSKKMKKYTRTNKKY